jgi:tricorn protease interacting factor F2/3
VDVTPINYKLIFEPDLKKFTFNGMESISINCKKTTNIITMHCAELKIKSCIVKFGQKIIPSFTKTNEKKEELQIKLGKKLCGLCTVDLEFEGILNDRLLGFYRSKYEQNGKTKYLATTQFEAADARRAFPCWDEPEAKATFEISIIADNKFTAKNLEIKQLLIFKKHLLFQHI